MRTKVGKTVLIWVLVLALTAPTGVIAQNTGQVTEAPLSYSYTQQELDQMLAPIALYPDELLSQILMASTYPLEVVDADRWLKKNANLAGDRLDEALKDQPWDVSVKSLCYYPGILSTMSENLTQTSSLGGGFPEPGGSGHGYCSKISREGEGPGKPQVNRATDCGCGRPGHRYSAD